MIALDIDGTLLESGSDVPPVTIDAVETVREAGHHVVLATHRSLVGAVPVARSLGLHDSWIVAAGGAVIARLSPSEPSGYLVHDEHTFQADPVVQLVRSRKPDARLAVEQVGWGHLVTALLEPERIHGAQRVVGDVAELWATPAPHIVLCGDGVDILLEPLRRIGLTAAPDGSDWVDVIPRGRSKATGLETVRRRLGVHPAHTVAIGDDWHDREMLTWATTGIAMGHAPEAIKALAGPITGTLYEHGAATALRKLVLRGTPSDAGAAR